MTTNFDVNNPVNYKACRLKQYDVHVCMPSRGTYIVNKFETPSIFEAVKKEYFTEKELKELSEKGSQVFKDLQYGVSSESAKTDNPFNKSYSEADEILDWLNTARDTIHYYQVH